MTGVVLCGGGSTRMGSDKGLLKEEEQTWAEIAARKLAALQLPWVVSVNREQCQTYQQIFPPSQLLIDNEILSSKGPLIGLLSVHLQYPSQDLFVLACDVKDITTDLMRHLYNEAINGADEACVYQSEAMPQPLCGIYTARGLKKIYALVQEEKLHRFSMMHVLEVLDTQFVPVEPANLPYFRNYNSPDELEIQQG